jgi:predicted Fe-Mo cluster-binding NifX family protein
LTKFSSNAKGMLKRAGIDILHGHSRNSL